MLCWPEHKPKLVLLRTTLNKSTDGCACPLWVILKILVADDTVEDIIPWFVFFGLKRSPVYLIKQHFLTATRSNRGASIDINLSCIHFLSEKNYMYFGIHTNALLEWLIWLVFFFMDSIALSDCIMRGPRRANLSDLHELANQALDLNRQYGCQ